MCVCVCVFRDYCLFSKTHCERIAMIHKNNLGILFIIKQKGQEQTK